MQPAKKVIEMFGGVRALARLLKIDSSVVSRWQTSKDKRGQGGLIPAGYQGKLLKLAERKGLELTADDLVKRR